jgi:hypothetical protein
MTKRRPVRCTTVGTKEQVASKSLTMTKRRPVMCITIGPIEHATLLILTQSKCGPPIRCADGITEPTIPHWSKGNPPKDTAGVQLSIMIQGYNGGYNGASDLQVSDHDKAMSSVVPNGGYNGVSDSQVTDKDEAISNVGHYNRSNRACNLLILSRSKCGPPVRCADGTTESTIPHPGRRGILRRILRGFQPRSLQREQRSLRLSNPKRVRSMVPGWIQPGLLRRVHGNIKSQNPNRLRRRIQKEASLGSWRRHPQVVQLPVDKTVQR